MNSSSRKDLLGLGAAVDLDSVGFVAIGDIPDDQLYEDRSEMFRRMNSPANPKEVPDIGGAMDSLASDILKEMYEHYDEINGCFKAAADPEKAIKESVKDVVRSALSRSAVTKEMMYHLSLDKFIDLMEYDYSQDEIVDRLVAHGYPILRGELPETGIVIGGRMYVPVDVEGPDTCSSCGLLDICSRYDMVSLCSKLIGYHKHWEEKE